MDDPSHKCVRSSAVPGSSGCRKSRQNGQPSVNCISPTEPVLGFDMGRMSVDHTVTMSARPMTATTHGLRIAHSVSTRPF